MSFAGNPYPQAGPSTPSSLLNGNGSNGSIVPSATTYQQIQFVNPAQMIMHSPAGVMYPHAGYPMQHHYQMQPQVQPQQSQTPIQSAHPLTSPPSAPILATGDWTRDLVHLSKTAELKKHALTLQMHTSNIVSAHAVLEAKSNAIHEIRDHKARLDNERQRLLECLREISEDKDKTDLLETKLTQESTAVQQNIDRLTANEYAHAKADVVRLRAELRLTDPIPGLKEALDARAPNPIIESTSANRNDSQRSSSGTPSASATSKPTKKTRESITSRKAEADAAHAMLKKKRVLEEEEAARIGEGGTESETRVEDTQPPVKRSRGRPKGSKNKKPDGMIG